MAGLKEIRKRLSTVESTRQLTSAMKMVSASKLRKAQHSQLRLKAYTQELAVLFNNIVGNEELENPAIESLLHGDKDLKNERVLILVLTSDKGLCGTFNTQICKAVEERIKTIYSHLKLGENLQLLCIGSKGAEYFRRKSYPVLENRYDINVEKLDYEMLKGFVNTLLEDFYMSIYSRIEVAFFLPVNAAVQKLKIMPILPLGDWFSDPIFKDEKKAQTQAQAQAQPQTLAQKQTQGDAATSKYLTEYIMEPEKHKMLKDFLPLVAVSVMYFVFMSSLVSEHGARMTAMSKATDNAETLSKALNRQYNKMRQASITNELLEIVSGANALK